MPADEKKEAETKQQADQDAPEPKNQGTENMDFADMDLTVESVEERISPSETNVFDK